MYEPIIVGCRSYKNNRILLRSANHGKQTRIGEVKVSVENKVTKTRWVTALNVTPRRRMLKINQGRTYQTVGEK